MNAILAGLLAIVLYLTASTLLAVRLSQGSIARCCQRSHVIMIGLAAILIHGGMLYPDLVTVSGLDLGFFNAVSLIALTTALLLILASLFEPVENLGIPVFPVAALSIALVLLYPEEHLVAGAASFWQLDFHILTSLLSYSILALAAMQAVLLAQRGALSQPSGAMAGSEAVLATMDR